MPAVVRFISARTASFAVSAVSVVSKEIDHARRKGEVENE
jgi:hypothetical protein